jgi:Family of unknown function (DUF6346)
VPLDDRYAERLAELRAELDDLDRQEEQQEREAAVARVVEPTTPLGRRAGRLLRSLLFWVVLLGLLAGLAGLAVTLNRLSGNDMADAERLGQAAVESCTRHGPITARGFGYWHSCEVEIAWVDGEADGWTVDGVFRSSDVGRTVQVGDLKNAGNEPPTLARAGEAARPWLKWLGYGAGALAFVPLFFMGLLLGVYPGRRRKRRS